MKSPRSIFVALAFLALVQVPYHLRADESPDQELERLKAENAALKKEKAEEERAARREAIKEMIRQRQIKKEIRLLARQTSATPTKPPETFVGFEVSLKF